MATRQNFIVDILENLNFYDHHLRKACGKNKPSFHYRLSFKFPGSINYTGMQTMEAEKKESPSRNNAEIDFKISKEQKVMQQVLLWSFCSI